MNKIKKLAVIGATGVVGRLVVEYLRSRNFPAAEILLVASKKSEGISALNDFSFNGVDLALFCVPNEVAIKYVPIATKAGAFVVDNSSYYRTDPAVPIIIPEINGAKIKEAKKNIIANSNCAAIQMLMVLKPLHDFACAKRVVISTYQSASGIGKLAMDELLSATQDSLNGKATPPKNFPKSIAFNVIPQIDKLMEDGRTIEEWKIQHDTNKIMEADIRISACCVRVPVEIGHSESVNIEFQHQISPEKATELLVKMPGVKVTNGYITPIEAAGKDEVFVSRIRQDKTLPHGLNLWIVSDNLRKGAALNTVQIAEEFLKMRP